MSIPHSLTVEVCDAAFTKLAEVEAGEFQGAVRNLAPGHWNLSTPVAALDCDPDEVGAVLVWDESMTPARILFGGKVTPVEGVSASAVRSATPEGSVVEWSGVDLWGLLGTRLVFPDPSTAPPWSVAHDTRTDVASTVAAGLIDDNYGASALAARSVSDLSVIDPVVGTSGTWSFRLQPLSDAVAQVCREAGIGCLASMPSVGVIRFEIRSYLDRSASVVLSDQGDLEGLTRVIVPSSASWVVAAGSGELAARLFETADSGVSGLARVERLYDVSNITTSAALTRAAASELSLGATDVAVDGQLTESAAQQLRWGTNYELGDTLAVEINSVRHTAQVESIQITVTPDRQVVRPSLGRTPGSLVGELLSDVAGLGDRFSRNVG